MCGSSPAEKRVKIDGAKLSTCSECAELGEVMGEVRKEKPSKNPGTESNDYSGTKKKKVLLKDLGKKIREAREEREWKIKELADRLKEKTSVIRRVENGDLKPSNDLVGKFERELNLDLYEEIKYENSSGGSESNGLTIGDVVDIK